MSLGGQFGLSPNNRDDQDRQRGTVIPLGRPAPPVRRHRGGVAGDAVTEVILLGLWTGRDRRW